MNLVLEQSEFLKDVCKLIVYATELGYLVTAGELERQPEAYELYAAQGRRQPRNSGNVRKCAIDLSFFRRNHGELKLDHEVQSLKPIGQFWESLSPHNSWGGSWNRFTDVPHFERRV